MIADRLRKAVLQAAMEGKLTEQLSDDGNAIEYITKYKIKKLNDIADFPKIPKSWIYTNLGEIGIWKAGSTPLRSKTEYYQNGNIPWLKTGDLNNGIIYDIPECITEKALNETSLKLNPVGSILMAMYGATIGKLGILGIEATTNQACIACITKDFVYNKFLFYYLYSEQDKFIKKGVGGAQPNISREKIVATEFPLPPIEEQKRIVEKLEVLLAEIDKLEQDEKALKDLEDKFPVRLKKSLLKSAIGGNFSKINLEYENKVDKLKYQNNESLNEVESLLGKINYNWIVTNLKQIADISTGRKDANHAKQNGIYRFYTCAKEYFMTDTFSFEGESLILPGNGANVGQVYRYSGKFEAYQRTYIIQVKSNFYQYIDMNYLEYLFHAYWGEYNKDKMFGSATPYIKLGNLVNFPVVIPPIDEQKRIVEKLDKLFAIDLLNI